MKSSTLLLAFLSVAAVTGCSTAYKTGQTPDDVYYSAAKPQNDDNDNKDSIDRKEDRYSYSDESYDDRFLRMKVRNRHQWSELDDWYYYDKYSSVYTYYFGSYNNPYNSWNYYYNPYCCCRHSYYNYSYYPGSNIKYIATPPVVKRNFNLAGYTNTSYNNGGSYRAPSIKTSNKTYNNNNNSSFSDKVKTIFSNNNGSSRTYSPSSSSGNGNNGGSSGGGSGKSGGGSGGTAPVSRPVRK